MPAHGHAIARHAFSSDEWGKAVASLREAAGIGVWTITADGDDAVGDTSACAYCQLAEAGCANPARCFADLPLDQGRSPRAICASGLAALVAPVMWRDTVVAHVLVSGFITSTRERRALYERALARGVDAQAATKALRAIPLVPRRQAEAYLQVALATARTVVDASIQRQMAAQRVNDLRLLLSTGQSVASAEKMDSSTLEAVLGEAVMIAHGIAGAVLRPSGPTFEIVAATEAWSGRRGSNVPKAATAAGKALQTRKPVFGPSSPDDGLVLAMPVLVGARALGVLEIKLTVDELPPTRELARLARFGQFLALTLDREDERLRVGRAMRGYAELNALASRLGAQTDSYDVVETVVSTIARALTFDVCGIVLHGWGKDSARLVCREGIDRVEARELLCDVSGRDSDLEPFEELSVRELEGQQRLGETEGEWATSSFELSFGDLNLGWVFVGRCDCVRYSAEDRALLEGVAAHAGPAFARAALFARIRDDYEAAAEALRAHIPSDDVSVEDPASIAHILERMTGQALGLDALRLWSPDISS